MTLDPGDNRAGATPISGEAACERRTARLVRAGILFIVGAGFLFTILDAGNKFLTETYAIVQVVWARYAFQWIVVPAIIGRVSLASAIRTRNLPLQILRSLLLLLASASFVTAIHFVPLADASAVGKVGPLMLTALSIPLLGEHVGARRWAAVVVGFIGALVIIRPGFGTAHWALFLPLLTAFFFALYSIITRLLSRVDPPVTTFLYTGVVGTLVATAAVPFFWRTPDLVGWLLMIGTGTIAGLGHLSLIQAYKRAPASVLAPFGYVQLIWATLVGFAVFGDFPDTPTILGALIIMASGIYVIYREGRAKRRRRN